VRILGMRDLPFMEKKESVCMTVVGSAGGLCAVQKLRWPKDTRGILMGG
jgi:hypothetical protein